MEEYRRRGPSRAAVKQLKESVQNAGHKTGLPPKLLQLFSNRDVPPFKPKPKRPPKLPYTGLAGYVGAFASPGDAEYDPPKEKTPSSPRLFRNRELPLQGRISAESKLEKYLRIQKYKKEDAAAKIERQLKDWDPNKDPNVEGDPYKTLFIARMSFDVSDKKLKREFEEFGPVKRIRVVADKKTGKPRGYAFIEYEHKGDMKEAYKAADGRKMEGRRVLVDVERGRTVENWRPRRLGGGSGGSARDPKDPKHPNALGKHLAAAMERAGMRKDAATRHDGMGDAEREVERDRERQRSERDKVDRERADRERADRERAERDRRERERFSSRDFGARDRGGRDDRYGSSRDDRFGGRDDRGGSGGGVRDDRERERRDRDKRARSPSPRRDDPKRRHTEDGEVRGGDRRDRDRKRERDLL